MLKVGALIAFVVLLAAQAPIARSLNDPLNQDKSATRTEQRQGNIPSPIPPSKINSTNPQLKSTGDKNDKPKSDPSWRNWLANNDHWLVFGTLILAVAAIAQVLVSLRTTRRQLRAYVLLDGGNVYDASGIGIVPPVPIHSQWVDFVKVTLNLKNSGQTPAKDVVHWAQIAIGDATTEYLMVPPARLDEIQASVVGPGQSTTKSIIWLPFPLVDPARQDITAHQKGIYVYGKVVYRDIFNRQRTTTYRVRYSGEWPPVPAGTFMFCLKGNDFT
jgi:hypothetical protein